MNDASKRIVHFLLLAVAIGVLTFLVPQSIGLGAGGFDSSAVLQEFSFYLVGGIFLLLIVLAFFVEIIIKKGDERYGNSIAFSSQGESPHVPFFKKFSDLQLFLLSTIIFFIIFILITTVRQTSFIGYKTLEQQFTPIGELLYSTLLVAGSENLGMALVIALLVVGLRAWARRTNMSKANFNVLFYTISIIGASYWIINHLLRYGGQDYKLSVVFLFGFAMAIITLLTGSFIPAFVMHASNNLFFDTQGMFSRDNIVIGVIVGIIFLAIIYFLLYRNKYKKKVEAV